MEQLRAGTSPRVGKQLRGLLTEAGFVRCEATAPGTVRQGNPEEVARCWCEAIGWVDPAT